MKFQYTQEPTDDNIGPGLKVQRRDGWGYIYLLFAYYTDLLKIGYSQDPIKRFKSLKTGSPLPLGFCTCVFLPNPAMHEAILHEKYASFRTKGEWFEFPNPDDFHEIFMEFIALEDQYAEDNPPHWPIS